MKARYLEEAYLIGRNVFVKDPLSGKFVKAKTQKSPTSEEMAAIQRCKSTRIELEKRRLVKVAKDLEEVQGKLKGIKQDVLNLKK